MSEPEDEPVNLAHIAPIIVIGIVAEPGQRGSLGYVIHEGNLNAVVESGAVHDLMRCMAMMMEHPAIVKAVQDQDLMDRLEVT